MKLTSAIVTALLLSPLGVKAQSEAGDSCADLGQACPGSPTLFCNPTFQQCEDVIFPCDAAISTQFACCAYIGNDFCSGLQSDCYVDAVPTAVTNAGGVNAAVRALVTAPINAACPTLSEGDSCAGKGGLPCPGAPTLFCNPTTETCEDLFPSTAEACQAARDRRTNCCTSLLGTVCDDLQEDCSFDAAVIAAQSGGNVIAAVANNFGEPLAQACQGIEEDNVDPGMVMDPHVKKWNGVYYDFDGECDLVLLKAPGFAGVGLDVHVRTTIRESYSYIEAAVVKLGEDTFELTGWGDYVLNSVESARLPNTMASGRFNVTRQTEWNGKTVENKKRHHFLIQLDEKSHIELSTFKDFVNVNFNVNLEGSVGLMGDYRTGKSLARDGKTILEDPFAFGQEWQVLPSEPQLFQISREPQAPHKCTLPDATAKVARLGQTVAQEAAEKACAHWRVNRQACVHDVLATGDLEVAQV